VSQSEFRLPKFKRTREVPEFDRLYVWAESFLRLYFIYRKRVFSRAVLRYDPLDPDWVPEHHPCFSLILVLAEVGLEHGLSPREYLAALIFGRQVLSRKVQALEFFSFDEEDLVTQDAFKAIENYLLVRESYSEYQLPTLGEVYDPSEAKMQQTEVEDQTWGTIREASKSDEEALIKILSSPVVRMFRIEFFEKFPEFRALRKAMRFVVGDDGISWIA